jgi:hypothetical protein
MRRNLNEMTQKQATDKQRESTEGRKRRLANLKPFQKGVSGNPNGRPKSLTLSEAFRRQLSQLVPNDPDGRTFAEVIALRVCVAAAQGDISAAREIADRTEGKPKQALDLDLKVTDWRELAKAHGVSEEEVVREAQLLIEQTTSDGERGER